MADAEREIEAEPETEPGRETGSPSATLLGAIAAAIGLELPPERAAALATQAESHFALLRALDGIAQPNTEPAAEFHLDAWRSAIDG
jgi:hypothetical protein